jgi:hypothetical protein
VPDALPFLRQAAARYSDEATADAIEYIAVSLGMPVSKSV